MTTTDSNYCLEHNCSKCCERFILRVTEADLKRWVKCYPKIMNEVSTKKYKGEIVNILRKKPRIDATGKIRNICVFYDRKKNCLIYEIRPDNCKQFTCTKHLYFIFQLFNEVSRFMNGCNPI